MEMSSLMWMWLLLLICLGIAIHRTIPQREVPLVLLADVTCNGCGMIGEGMHNIGAGASQHWTLLSGKCHGPLRGAKP